MDPHRRRWGSDPHSLNEPPLSKAPDKILSSLSSLFSDTSDPDKCSKCGKTLPSSSSIAAGTVHIC